LKVSIFIFLLAMLASGLIFAEESGSFSSRPFSTAETGFNLDYGNDQIAERVIDQRIIDRFASFDPSDGGQSSRYSLSFDLENEDSDWNFEVTVTIEF
jgi:hypothetical protein